MAKKTKRLADLFVGEISLVDKGAVPESDFVISKRDVFEEEPEPTEEELFLAKALDSDGKFRLSYALELMAETTRLVAYLQDMEKSDEGMPEECKSMLKGLREMALAFPDGDEDEDGDEPVEKVDDTPAAFDAEAFKAELLGAVKELVADEISKTAPTEPTPEPEPEEKPDPKVLEALKRLSSSVDAIAERAGGVETRIARACGKET